MNMVFDSTNNMVFDYFADRVAVEGDWKGSPHWLWQGPKSGQGYGHIRRGKLHSAHRYAYTIYVGQIPMGTEIDHLCRVRHCVNPAHLEAVPHKVNIERGETGIHQREKTHCPAGHAYSVDNTREYRGSRHCRACDRARKASGKVQ